MRWFVRGDIDGFFGLALDNLIQLLLIDTLCRSKFVLGFPDELLYRHVLPGAAVSLLVGNLFYSWQALRLARRTGRTDVCAQPYGINTVSLFAYVFLVMKPAKALAEGQGMSNADASLVAWQAGLVACFGCGLIEFLGAFVAEPIRKMTPRAALLSTLAGIALGFISLGFLLRTFAHPIVGLAAFGIVMLVYFGKVKFRFGVPGGFVAVALGTALAYATGVERSPVPSDPIGFYPPLPVLNDLLAAFRSGHLLTYLPVILPMGLFTLIGSLQNIEAAEAAGDLYPTAPSLIANGLGTMAASLFGSCFPTTIYIGHPGWKALGARAGYSVLNGLFFTVVCLGGILGYLAHWIPIDAGMAIVLWIGIVITAQAFQACPKEHAPAVVIGLLPGVAAWGTMLMKQALQVAGTKFSPDLFPGFHQRDNWLDGAFAVSEGFIFTSTILSAATVCLIERRFLQASAWCLGAAVLSGLGFMHSYRFLENDTTMQLWKPAREWAIGYAIMGISFLAAKWLTRPAENGH